MEANKVRTPAPSDIGARVAGVLVLSALIGITIGVGAAHGLFALIQDRNPDPDEWFHNLGQALISMVFGVGIAIAVNGIAINRGFDKWTPRSVSRAARLQLTLLPLVVTGVSIPLGYAPFSFLLWLPPFLYQSTSLNLFLFQGAPLLWLIGAALVMRRERLIGKRGLAAVAAMLAAYFAFNLFSYAHLLVTLDNEDAAENRQTIRNWNGPLMLINGTSARHLDESNPEYENWIDYPYDNDPGSELSLSWRSHDGDFDDSGYFLGSVDFENTPLSEVCSYEGACEEVGQSKFGPVYKDESTTALVVAVPKGHLAVTLEDNEPTDPIALINSLEPVTAEQFNKAAKGVQEG